MKIAVLADGKEQKGGNNEIIYHIKKALVNYEIDIEYINEDNYLPKVFPF